MVKPFLLRYAKPCLSPDRVSINPQFEYDEIIDMVRWLGLPDHPLIIDAYKLSLVGGGPDEPPITKKADLEKGEDQKDRRMWNRN
ncbi:MAG: hypothetical protein ACYDH1_10190 [Anaerolineaceae bacterium]